MYLCSVNMKKHRTIIFYKNYFQEFFDKQREKVKDKIIWTLELLEELERVPETYLKHVENTDGLYEIKVSTTFKEIRILCFFDESKLVVVINWFFKKSKKAPKQEIELGERLKNEYLEIKKRRR